MDNAALPDWAGIVLAAGKGTRMRSRLAKVLHPIAGRAMVEHVTEAVNALGLAHTVVVVGYQEAAIRSALGDRAVYASQPEALGTGHAVLQARRKAGAAQQLLVVNGDLPLIQPETLCALIEHHKTTDAALTLLTCRRQDPAGLGRVVRDSNGRITAIVEHHEANEGRRALTETNEGAYCLDAASAWPALECLPTHANGERYLTDLVELTVSSGRTVESVASPDPQETSGVNDRVQLAEAEAVMRQRVRVRLMQSGVTIIDPPSAFIDAGVEIGMDTVIHPNTTLTGSTVIGEDNAIGPGAVIRDSRIGNACEIAAAVIEGAVLEDRVSVGPFSHLRPDSLIETGVHLGNYVEVKNSNIGQDSQAGHFCYLGDARIGRRVNIGAGTITCNYDGVDKHVTTIGNDVFIGSDSMLVAPVTIGSGAATGAGAVVTQDVPPETVVVGAPARVLPGKRGKHRNAPKQEA